MNSQKISTKENSKLSNEIDKLRIPKHIAIIMDGNGRWAIKKGFPRSFGHNKGVNVLKEIIKVSKKLGCKTLTVYAFSTENWSRPAKEVDFLIDLFEKVINREIEQIHKSSIKINFVGDLTPFPKTLKLIINRAQSLTENNKEFTLNICINYGGRQEIVKVAKELALKSFSGEIKPKFLTIKAANISLCPFLVLGIKSLNFVALIIFPSSSFTFKDLKIWPPSTNFI